MPKHPYEPRERKTQQPETSVSRLAFLAMDCWKEMGSEKRLEKFQSLHSAHERVRSLVGFLPSFPESPKDLPQFIHFLVMALQNNVTRLSDAGIGEKFAEAEGEIMLEAEGKKVQLDQGERKSLSREQKIVLKVVGQELKKLIQPPQQCKILVTSRPGFTIILVDAGSHKERIAIMHDPQQGERAAWYEHIPSSFEKENPKKTYRPSFVEWVLASRRRRPGEGPQVLSLIDLNSQLSEDQVGRLVRLALSVKDLDLTLTEKKLPTALQLFEAGATNLVGCLNFLQAGGLPEEGWPGLNEQEVKVIKRARENMDRLEAKKAGLKEAIVRIRVGRELNYEIIDLLLQLQGQGDDIKEGRNKPLTRYDSPVQKLSLLKQKMQAMKDTLVFPPAEIDIQSLVQKFEPIVDAVEALSNTEHGFSSEQVRQAWIAFSGIFSDKGGDTKSWADVYSLEEAVRFLHRSLYTQIDQFTLFESDFKTLLGQGLTQTFEPDIQMHVIDVGDRIWQETLAGNIAWKKIRSLGESRQLDEKAYSPPMVLAGDDFIELSYPQGKHYVEVAAMSRVQEPQEFTITFKYVESGYQGSADRQNFVEETLQSMGFRRASTDPRGRVCLYSLKTEDLATWEKTLAETIRLVYAIPDLDLHPELARRAGELFKKGITHINSFGVDVIRLEQLLRDSPGKLLKDELEEVQWTAARLLRQGGQTEARYVAKLLLEKVPRPSEWKTVLHIANQNDLDRLISALIELEDEARKGKEKNRVRLLAGRANLVMDVLDSHPPKNFKHEE